MRVCSGHGVRCAPNLQEKWPEAARPEDWEGVTMENGRVVKLVLGLFWPERGVPTELGQLTSLKVLNLDENQLTSVPAEIGQLATLESLDLYGNKLTSVPADIGQLTSLEELDLNCNQLTSVPAEIGQLAALRELYLTQRQSANERAGGDRAAHVAGPQKQSADEPGGDRAAHVAGGVEPRIS